MPASTQPTREELAAKVSPGEETKSQSASRGNMAFLVSRDVGFDKPPPGTFETYRRMRRNPTLAMARAAAFAPIRSAGMTIVAEEGVNENRRQFIEEQLKPHWRHIVNQALHAIDYGVQVFELVYDLVRDGETLYTIKKAKPLWPDQTELLIDKTTGAYNGVKQGDIILSPEKTLRYSYDVEGTNWWGRSRHENVRETAWVGWEGTAKKMSKYGAKIAGVLPIIMYPEGQSRDSSGATVDNFDLATKMMDRLGVDMQGIAMPNAFAKWAGDLLQRGVDLSQLRPWLVQFHEPTGQHGGDFVTQLAYWDKQLARGWLVPERVFQEGEHGTKAEAGVHTDIVLATAQEIYEDIAELVNLYVIDRLGVLNWPDYQRGDIRLKPSPIIDDDRIFLRELISKVLGGAGLATLLTMLDLESMIEQAGLPLEMNPDADFGNTAAQQQQSTGEGGGDGPPQGRAGDGGSAGGDGPGGGDPGRGGQGSSNGPGR